MHDLKETFSSIIVDVFNISPDLGGDVQDLDVSIAPRGGQGGGGTFGAVRRPLHCQVGVDWQEAI